MAFMTLYEWLKVPGLKEHQTIFYLNSSDFRETLDLEPPGELSCWYLTLQSKEEYLAQEEKRLGEYIAADGLLSLSAPDRRSDLIESVMERARKYCADSEKHMLQNERGVRRVRKVLRLSDHMKWAVRVRVLGEEFEVVAKEEECEGNTIKKAVQNILLAIRLPLEPTFHLQRGRPRGRLDSPSVRRHRVNRNT
jgi:hypothetical protein